MNAYQTRINMTKLDFINMNECISNKNKHDEARFYNNISITLFLRTMQTAIDAVNASGSGTPRRETREKRSRSAPAPPAVSQSAYLPDSLYGSGSEAPEGSDRDRSRSRPRWASQSSSESERVSLHPEPPNHPPPGHAPASSAVSQRQPAAPQRQLTAPQQRFVDDFLAGFPELRGDINGRDDHGWNALHLGVEDH